MDFEELYEDTCSTLTRLAREGKTDLLKVRFSLHISYYESCFKNTEKHKRYLIDSGLKCQPMY